ncbi:MAG: methenyltetrahydromethanopterin cyclohydrolase [Pirellulales bacterium]|nr:methenyltetrahydromethanopterin cyclohydrolase [Pirellulales bacterium]
MDLNGSAQRLLRQMIDEAPLLKIEAVRNGVGTTILDCGIRTGGGLEAGRWMAEICLAGLGGVSFVQGNPNLWPGPAVQVCSDHPVAACMASQYAGWKLEGKKFFAMGSGPMRAAGSREPLFDQIGFREKPGSTVGVLETRKIPPDEVCQRVAEACGIAADQLTLLVAPTASLAGAVQIVARSIETAIHKLHELGFDLSRIDSGYGVAPLPPVAADDLVGIGRTNDAILYGGEVTLWVRGDDDSLQQIGEKIPSSASSAHGEPFADIFSRHNGDFYAIDPMLFSPAVVTFNNLDTGRVFRFGHAVPQVIHRSFGM